MRCSTEVSGSLGAISPGPAGLRRRMLLQWAGVVLVWLGACAMPVESRGQAAEGVTAAANSKATKEEGAGGTGAVARPLEDSFKYISDGQLQVLSHEDWVAVARVMGDPSVRSRTLDHLRKQDPFPAKLWVGLLNHGELSVRLGALEVLEEYTGHDLDFDPWEQDAAVRSEAWQRWSQWAEGGGKALPGASAAASLSAETMQGYLRDIMSGDPAQTERAVAKLKPFSHQGIGAIETFLTTQTSLLPGMRGRLKEAQYRLLLDLAGVRDARRVARFLAIGTRDERVEGLDLISHSAKSVLPIVNELLKDSDGLVRERAMDVLLALGGAASISKAVEHLKTEKDVNVIHAAIRSLGKIEGSASVRALLPYLEGTDEDMVSTTLLSLSLLGTSAQTAKPQIEACLKHQAWRVRSAALQCITKIRLTGMDKDIIAMLNDEDSFVRAAAVQALAVSAEQGSRTSFGVKRLLTGDGTNATTEALVAAFEKHDDLKGVIIKAFADMRQGVPQKLLDALGKAPPDVLTGALATLQGSSTAETEVLIKYAGSSDLDVACTALRNLAAHASNEDRVGALLAAALLGKDPAKRDAVLDSLEWSTGSRSTRAWEEAVKKLQGNAATAPPPTVVPPRSGTSPSLEDELKQAFGGGAKQAPKGGSPAPAAPPSGDGKKSLLDELVGAFTPKPGPEAAGTTTGAVEDVGGLEGALVRLAGAADLAGTDDAARLARQAALLLVTAGSPQAVPYYQKSLAKVDVQDRAELADALSHEPAAEYIPIWQSLLSDPSREVRQRAVRSALYEEDRTWVIRFAMLQLMQPEAVLNPADAYGYTIESLARDDRTKKQMLESARQMIALDRNPPLQVLGLVILRHSTNAPADREVVAKLTRSPYYWVRRAAVVTQAKIDSKALEENFSKYVADSSAWVREAAAASQGNALKAWTHHFDDNTEAKDELQESTYEFDRSFGGFGSTRNARPEPKAETMKLLRHLTDDSEDRVRLCAWMSLLAQREQVNVEALCGLMDRSPDRETWSRKLADFVESNYNSLGPALRPLVERINWKYVQANKIPAIEKHFGIGGSGQASATEFAAFASVAAPVAGAAPAAQYVTPSQTGSEPVGEPEEVRLGEKVHAIFFHNPGCAECESVRKDLAALKRRYTGLQVQEHNIRDTDAVLLNEALSKRYAVPPARRQVAPAVFFQEGVLIKSDLNRFALEELLRDSIRAGDTGKWFEARQEDIAAAKQVVEKRYEGMHLAGVFMAGLLDGINPCAFATIIFFLSYMQVTRRSPRGILAVGVAFIAGVFISYFVLGLGLVEVVARLEAFRVAAAVLNWVLAIACLVIAFLSFRDAKRARQGRLQDMTLQLPGFLKTGIRGVIRTGAKSSHFVIAAFISGLIIAALELACTGQVYLPTIVYAMKTGVASATAFLLLYNIAFIVPLSIIFILAWRGMKSETLVRFQKNHTATVKYALGCLFLGLFLMILWSGRL